MNTNDEHYVNRIRRRILEQTIESELKNREARVCSGR